MNAFDWYFLLLVWQEILSQLCQIPKYSDWLPLTGAIDGKHIQIQNPALSGSQYFNYKRYYSTVLPSVTDAKYRFVYIDVGSYGKDYDTTVFAQSTFGNELQAGHLNFPQAQEEELPYAFLADEAFN